MSVLYEGDCRDVLKALPAASFGSVVCDPPYELDFMAKAWDRTGVAFDPATWKAVIRVLSPGGYMLAFGGTRTYHRLACAIEDAGFEIRDCLMWLYGTGFPKGQGCLKPAWEPILLARKPGKRVLPLQVDACRVPCDEAIGNRTNQNITGGAYAAGNNDRARSGIYTPSPAGRYPANVLHDGSDEVLEAFAAFGEKKVAPHGPNPGCKPKNCYGKFRGGVQHGGCYADTGTAARFFYAAKASKRERGEGNTHPTVKPLALMRWLVRLITPPGGSLVDPFAGSGTTLVAAELEGLSATGIEQDAGHCDTIRKRLAEANKADGLFAEVG